MNQVRQESLTLETLDLLQKTADYLKRLPVVPVTQQLIREIDAHLADPNVAAARREAEAAALLASKRVAQSLTPVGQVLFEAVVEGEKITFRAPPLNFLRDHQDNRMERLADGITMKIQPPRGP